MFAFHVYNFREIRKIYAFPVDFPRTKNHFTSEFIKTDHEGNEFRLYIGK